MEPTGKGEKGILIIGEASGKMDDAHDAHFMDRSGEILRECLDNIGIDLDTDCWKTNSVQCRPMSSTGVNRTPTPKEIAHCRQRVWADIEQFKPKAIILLGGIALESFLGGRWKKDMGGINRWRGWTIPDRDAKAWTCPTFHPSYVLRCSKEPVVRLVFEQDLERAIQQSRQPLPVFKDEADEVQILGTPNLVKRYFTPWFRGKPSERPKLMSFDYETTGLKPHRIGHHIRCASVTTDRGTIAFSMSEEIKEFFKGLLENHRIGKSAHNLGFEDSWSNECLDAVIEGWEWDSQMAAHVLDNRGGISSLKFQAYVNFGVIDYDSEISHYLKGGDKDSNSFNRVNDAPIEKLLIYCGMDSLFGYRLTLLQQKQIKERGLQDAYDLFHEGLLSLAEMEQTGFRLDAKQCRIQQDKLTDKIKTMNERLLQSEIGKIFIKEYGKTANINSPVQLANVLFNHLKVKSVKKTATGKPSVDEDALSKMNIPFVKKLMEIRKIKKNLNTYLKGFMREEVDGLIHPFYHLNTTKSFRSCIAEGSIIEVVRDVSKYPDGIPIEKVKKGDWAYCYNKNLDLVIKKVLWAGKTGNQKVIRIHWKGKVGRKGYLDLTPEHKVRLVDGQYVEAQKLVGDYRKDKKKKVPKIGVLALSRKTNSPDLLYVTRKPAILDHRLIYEYCIGALDKNEVVHHKDGNHYNNELFNLEKMKLDEHSRLHEHFTEESRQKGYETRRKHIKEGKIKFPKGEEHHDWIHISKFSFLRLLSKHGGQTKHIGLDHYSIHSRAKIFNIDLKVIRDRYDVNGKYISKGRLARLAAQGRTVFKNETGANFYKTLRIYKQRGINPERKWGNQCGPFVPNNHSIDKIEWLDKEMDVYDIEVEGEHNFIANQLCIHNSSSRPNSQNIPVRNEDANKLIRGLIIPRDGNRILETDFKSIEVGVAACITQDPKLLEYMRDPTTDMHRDMCMQIYSLKEKEVSKDARYSAKNGFVFPQFYGDWYEPCAKNLWENITTLNLKVKSSNMPMKEHLANNGIKSLKKFTSHLRDVEDDFWRKRFRVYDDWKVEQWKVYQRKGYIDLITGFRCTEIMDKNAVLNRPVQGTAFHCLLWTLNQLIEIKNKEDWESKFIMQIHDSIILDMVPKEQKQIVSGIEKIVRKELPEMWDWIIIPLSVEYEITPINGSWHTKKESNIKELLNDEIM